MSNDRFEIEPTYEEPQPSKSMGCLKGCLIVCGILFLLLLVLIFVVYKNWRSWTSSFASNMIEQSLEASSLPDQEKVEVKQELDRVVSLFEENKLSFDQMERIMSALVQSPLMNTFIVSAVETRYLKNSGLAPDEIDAGKVSLNRFVSGMFQEKIKEEEFEDLFQHIATKKGDGKWELREPDQVSDDDLRAMLVTAKDKADAADIPLEIDEVDPSDEVRRIIDEALDRPLGQPAAEEPVEAAPAGA